MSATMFLILKMNVIAAVMIVAAVIWGKLTKRKYSSKWKYCMWLMVMIFLLIPVDFSAVSPVKVKISQNSFVENQPKSEVFSGQNAGQDKNMDSMLLESLAKQRELLKKDDVEIQVSVGKIGTDQVLNAAFVIWIAGILLFGILRGFRYYVSLHKVRRWSYAVDDTKVLGLYFFLCKRKHVKRPPRLLMCDDINSPMLAGLIHPGLYLPKENYTIEELEFIFSHELSHHIRRDLWYKMLMLVVLSIHWFNPALYWMQHEANKDIENLCDGKMAAHYNSKEKSLYGQLLLKVAAAQNHVPYLAVSLNDSKQVFKERIVYMKNIRILKEKIFPAVLLSVIMISTQFLVGCSTEALPKKTEVTAETKEQKKEEISRSKESKKEADATETAKSVTSKQDKKTVSANIENKSAAVSAVQPKNILVSEEENPSQLNDSGTSDTNQQDYGSGQDFDGSDTNDNDVEATEPGYSGPVEENPDTSDNSDQWFDPDEIELTGEQKTLYSEDEEAYSGVFVYRGTDGYWYDGEYWKYSDLGGGRWLCNTDGSSYTDQEPAFSPDLSHSQATITDESGQNQKTIYLTADSRWRTENGEYWEALGYGDFSGPNGEVWHTVDGVLE